MVFQLFGSYSCFIDRGGRHRLEAWPLSPLSPNTAGSPVCPGGRGRYSRPGRRRCPGPWGRRRRIPGSPGGACRCPGRPGPVAGSHVVGVRRARNWQASRRSLKITAPSDLARPKRWWQPALVQRDRLGQAHLVVNGNLGVRQLLPGQTDEQDGPMAVCAAASPGGP